MFSLSSLLKRGLIANRLHCRTLCMCKNRRKGIMFFRVSTCAPAPPSALLRFCDLSLNPHLHRNTRLQRLGAVLYTPELRCWWFCLVVQIKIGIWNWRLVLCLINFWSFQLVQQSVCVLSNGLWKDVGVMWSLALEQGGGYGEFCFVVFHYFFLH